MALKIAGMVVLYNPTAEVLENIKSYRGQVEELYAIDNSDYPNHEIISVLTEQLGVQHISNGSNLGIASALNCGARKAIQQNFDLLLTMDQDSTVDKDFVAQLISQLREERIDRIGIICPRYTSAKAIESKTEVLFTMTSGNLLNLHAYQKVGPFLEKLFIDHVDHEFCLRLNQKGYKVIQLNNVEIMHRPGHRVGFRFFGTTISFSAHSPLRLYYFIRNGLYVSRLYRGVYPAYQRMFCWAAIKQITKIFLLDNRKHYYKMLIRAYRDYKTGNFGKINAEN